jgi:hypothetical protein
MSIQPLPWFDDLYIPYKIRGALVLFVLIYYDVLF